MDLQRLLNTLGHAEGMARLHKRFESQWCSTTASEWMLGTSAVMHRVSQKLSMIAKAVAPVLIRGETGTGKELAARMIHEQSDRAEGPFEAVNCAALPGNLIQTELFDHEKGSFTGAYQRKIGRFEAADGGTIFLDEIGDLGVELQVTPCYGFWREGAQAGGGHQRYFDRCSGAGCHSCGFAASGERGAFS